MWSGHGLVPQEPDDLGELGHGQAFGGEQTDLGQHRGVVPVDPFARHEAVAEFHHHDQRHFDGPSGRGESGQQGRDLPVVRDPA